MKMFATALAVSILALTFVSCETVDKSPQPEREKLSSIPHNMPESWEANAGMPGGGLMQQAYQY